VVTVTHTRTWTVEITIAEHEDERRTHAAAVLKSDGRTPLRGEGWAHRRPSDVEVPAIGDELATARALADLTHQLLELTAVDIEQFTKHPAHVTA
jgi:hypothetical protein